MGYKPKAPPVMAAPNVIPMADIMLVLLIIFMVITPMLQKGLPVNMAKAENAEKMPNADKDDAIIVAVTRDGHLFLGQHGNPARTRLPTRSKTSSPTGSIRRSTFAPMPAPSMATWSRRSTKCALPASKISAC